MTEWSACPAVEREPVKVGGAWVFRSTRVPVAALFENIKDGATVSDFLGWLPGVTRAQVEAVLEHAVGSLRPGRPATSGQGGNGETSTSA